MRFYNFINEKDVLDLSNEISDLNEKIQKECKSYLKLIQGKNPLIRGMDSSLDETGKKKVRKNRAPKGMPSDVFKKFNQWLEDNGHNRRDQSVSAITNPTHAEIFGSAYYIFPIGKISYSFIKAPDVNQDNPKTGWDYVAPEKFLEDGVDITEEGFENYFVTDKNFDKAYNAEFEMWINCDEYHFVDIMATRTVAKWDSNEQKFK